VIKEKQLQKEIDDKTRKINKLIKEIQELNWKAEHIMRYGIKPYEDFLTSL